MSWERDHPSILCNYERLLLLPLIHFKLSGGRPLGRELRDSYIFYFHSFRLHKNAAKFLSFQFPLFHLQMHGFGADWVFS